VPASVGASGELRKEPGLADPGRADDLNGAGSPGRELIEGVLEPLEFCTAPYEMVGELEDGPSAATIRAAAVTGGADGLAVSGSQTRVVP
jgi:hypothetical protein